MIVRRVALVLLLVTPLLMGCGALELPNDTVAISDGWDHRRLGSEAEPTEPPTEEEWEAAGDTQGDHWFRGRIPPDAGRAGLAVFRAYADRFDIFVNGRRVYAYRGANEEPGPRFHVVLLPRQSAGKEILLRFPGEIGAPFFGESPLLTTPDEVPNAIRYLVIEPMRESFASTILGFATVVFGLIAFVAWLLRRRYEGSRVFAALALFAILYGVRDLAQSNFVYLFASSAVMPLRVVATVTYLINVAVALVALALFGRGWRSSLVVLTWVFVGFAVLGLVSDAASGSPMSLGGPNNVLVILAGAVFVGNVIHARVLRQREFRPVVFGLAVFGLFALNENLEGLGIVSWRAPDESIGFLVLMAALAYLGARRIVNAERRLLSIESELATARKIQSSILPETMPDVDGLQIAARYVPMSAVAGDLYDFHPGENGKLGLIVADVSGHGVPAALIASMVKVLAAAEAKRHIGPEEILLEMNGALRGSLGRQFVTATYLSVDMESGMIRVANGGHPAPLLWRRNTGEWSELGGVGPLLGRFEDADYSATTTRLEPGDRIIVYTDGIVEARRAISEVFGEDRLRLVAEQSFDMACEDVATAIVAGVQAWSSSLPGDDLTLVVLDYRREEL